MTTPVPTFYRLEKWNPQTREWEEMHAGLNLLSPEKFVERYKAKGVDVRAIEAMTKKYFGMEEDPEEDDCVLCGEPHMHGMCLI